MSPVKILPNEMSIKSICLECKNYDLKAGACTQKNPLAKDGDYYLLLNEKSACFGFAKGSG
jgi:hypothetical protein